MAGSTHIVHLCIGASFLCAAPALCEAESQYTITNLGVIGGSDGGGHGLNDAGQATGQAALDGTLTAFLFTGGEVINIADCTGTSNSTGHGINAAGDIAGFCRSDALNPPMMRATLWSGGQVIDLGTLGGTLQGAAAFGLNDNGQVVGWGERPNGQTRPFLYENGVMTDLGTMWELPGGVTAGTGMALAINNAGQITGVAQCNDLPGVSFAAFIWSNGTMTPLGTFGGVGTGNDINEAGKIVGRCPYVSNGPPHAFLWVNGVMQDLGTLGGDASEAESINDNDQVVGKSNVAGASSDYRAFIWKDGVMTDLNTLIAPDSEWKLIDAHAINDAGQITGSMVPSGGGGPAYVFFLDPIVAQAPGDVTGDDVVNVDDLLAVINAWGTCPKAPESCPADIAPPPDGDGVVNIDDLLMVINHWG